MNSLVCGLRSELLRYFSGYSVLGILAFSGLVPWFVANFLGWPQNSDRFQAPDNVGIFWAVAASIAPVATFAGSYLVTRESYYGTIRRSVVTSGAMSVFRAKYVAALAVGMGTALAGIVVWGGSVVFSLTPTTREQLLATESLGPLCAVVLASSLGALWGCSLGWIIQHYYATTILTLLIPLAIELPLMANAPEVARWLPSGALAGVVSLPMEGLLEPVAAFLVSVAWTLIAGVGALWVVRRKEF
ncbi:hypothetical protein IRJ34_17170 [Paenarthrobacter sp. GOM3]|uniref:hypothetical protein n=1 Tax=Paenarthrobacter sp. GOM3 TaxID=2782567 RepID=UPI0020123B26|nr:hypothetical protein [Paenarthrobacter sp. GOM3]WOH18064.1 hypothetical protein IRJ34_17170 [Paenarthrobacter sp. GOM3]